MISVSSVPAGGYVVDNESYSVGTARIGPNVSTESAVRQIKSQKLDKIKVLLSYLLIYRLPESFKPSSQTTDVRNFIANTLRGSRHTGGGFLSSTYILLPRL